MNPKFILVSQQGDHYGTLRYGLVWNHIDLVREGETVRGGGWFQRDDNTRKFILYGRSIDFGKADMSYLDRIPATLKGYRFYHSDEDIIFPDTELKELDLSRIEWI